MRRRAQRQHPPRGGPSLFDRFLCFIFCFPVIGLGYYGGVHRTSGGRRIVIIPDKLPPHPVKRQRALSVSLQDKLYHVPEDTGEVPERQLGSRLMSLPFELREQIWQHCLCGNYLCFKIVDGRLRQVERTYAPDTVKQTSLLSIALTCRQLYFETINMLYEGNTIFVGPEVVRFLDRFIIVPRLEVISHLWLTWEIRDVPKPGTDEYKEWVDVWKQISGFKSLRKLLVDLKTHDEDFWHAWVNEKSGLTAPLKDVTCSETFLVSIGVRGNSHRTVPLPLSWRNNVTERPV